MLRIPGTSRLAPCHRRRRGEVQCGDTPSAPCRPPPFRLRSSLRPMQGGRRDRRIGWQPPHFPRAAPRSDGSVGSAGGRRSRPRPPRPEKGFRLNVRWFLPPPRLVRPRRERRQRGASSAQDPGLPRTTARAPDRIWVLLRRPAPTRASPARSGRARRSWPSGWRHASPRSAATGAAGRRSRGCSAAGPPAAGSRTRER